MAEFVFKPKWDDDAEAIAYFLDAGENPGCDHPEGDFVERIIRCRDCKSFAKDEKDFDSFMRGKRTSLCMSVDPDGFCSWAKPKEVECE